MNTLHSNIYLIHTKLKQLSKELDNVEKTRNKTYGKIRDISNKIITPLEI